MREKASLSMAPLMWEWTTLSSRMATEALAAATRQFTEFLYCKAEGHTPHEPEWSTPHTVDLALESVVLRNFSRQASGPMTLICAPLALHGATIADFTPRHSLVAALLASGLGRLYVADWQSATDAMKLRTIDNYMADLHVLIDQLGEPVNLIGLCHGGWFALAYAARFPQKIRRLVIAAAPVDLEVVENALTHTALATPFSVYERLVRFGGGIVAGAPALRAWHRGQLTDVEIRDTLQTEEEEERTSAIRFERWFGTTLDLPGAFYLETVRKIFLENQLARGNLSILGRRVSLKSISSPICILTASRDEIVAPAQTAALADLVATPAKAILRLSAGCNHLGLFMGRTVLQSTWSRIGAWLLETGKVPVQVRHGSSKPRQPKSVGATQ